MTSVEDDECSGSLSMSEINDFETSLLCMVPELFIMEHQTFTF